MVFGGQDTAHRQSMGEFSGAPADDQIAKHLTGLATRLDPAAHAIANLRRLSGGATQEIWQFSLAGAEDSALGMSEMILRRAPGGYRVPDLVVGLGVEARLLIAAATVGVPVPRVVHVLEEADGLGLGFVMEFIPGETLGGRIVKSEALAPARAKFAQQCGAILANIHRINPAGFPSLDRLSPAELVEQWRAAYRAADWPRPVFELTFNWLVDRCADRPTNPSLVHGDFRNGNLIVGPEGIRAVLDWELAHVGDRHEDLGWLCVNSWRFGRLDKPVGGVGDRDELFESYEAAGGQPIDRDAVHWWEVFGTLRWGAMCAGSAAAFRGDDPTPERAMIGRRTSETEIDLLRLMAD